MKRPPQLDDRSVMESTLKLRARLERLRASLMGHCLQLVYDDTADASALSAIQTLLNKRAKTLHELQQLGFENGLPPPKNPIQHLLAPLAPPAPPAPPAAAPSEPPAPRPEPTHPPPASPEPSPQRRAIQIRSRPPEALPPNPPTAVASQTPPLLQPPPPQPPPQPPPPLPPPVVNAGVKQEIEAALNSIKTNDADLVARRVQARRLLLDLYAEVPPLDAQALESLEGQTKEVGNLEYLCYAGLVPLEHVPDLRLVWLKVTFARLRALLQQPLSKTLEDRAAKVADQLKAFAKVHSPSPINGVAPKDRPLQGTWDGDARFNTLQLQKRLGADAEPPAPEPAPNADSVLHQLKQQLDANAISDIQRLVDKLLTLVSPSNTRLLNLFKAHPAHALALRSDTRRAIEQALKQLNPPAAPQPDAPSQTPDDSSTIIPDSWPWWPLTRGKSAVIIGGKVRPDQRQRIETAFGFSQLKWHSAEVRRDEALAKRIRRRRVDFVIFTRFAQHQESYIIRPACQSAGVPHVRLSHGYGVIEIKKVIETSLPPPPANDPNANNDP